MFGAFLDGVRRVARAPGILAGLWIVTIVLTVPLTLAVRGALAAHLGASLEADSALSGVNYDWMQEFAGQSSGLLTTFRPTIIGFGAVLDNLSALVDRVSRPALVMSAVAIYLGVLTVFSAGVIDRLARDRAIGMYGFLGVCGGFFFRFLRLGIVSAIVYGVIFGSFHPWLFDTIYPQVTRDMTAERSAFVVQVILYAMLLAPLAAFNLLFDYARVRAVVEDRLSMMSALGAAAGFMKRNLFRVAGLYILNLVTLGLVIGAYALVAPGAGSSKLSTWAAFIIGQVYIAARLWTKLVVWGSETALFQSRLAHRGYVRRAAPLWPESPAVEGLAGPTIEF